MQAQQQVNATSASNAAYVATTALQVRLETGQLLKDIKEYLEGKVSILDHGKNGEIVKIEITNGVPRCNAAGAQTIISRLKLIINPSYVQGNYEIDQYFREISSIRMSLATELMINDRRYRIDLYDYEAIIDQIMTLVKAFASRLVNNKERESYETTMRHVETNTTRDNEKRGML